MYIGKNESVMGFGKPERDEREMKGNLLHDKALPLAW